MAAEAKHQIDRTIWWPPILPIFVIFLEVYEMLKVDKVNRSEYEWKLLLKRTPGSYLDWAWTWVGGMNKRVGRDHIQFIWININIEYI